ncbi:uncharacterized protein WCC33_009249 [Rhinophrynus dorsalis]
MRRYTIQQTLGSGSFATAYLVTDAKDAGSQKVLKRIPCEGLRPDTTLPSAREAKLLGSLKHPFIVGFLGSFLEREDFCIITEYCEGGDLQNYIQQQKNRGRLFSEQHTMEWFIQLLLGVSYLHERLILHRDLKTKNIFLKNRTLKIGDFGVSRILAVPSDMATTFAGTPHYMSPEVFTHSGYNAKSDIWSLGCILYEMCTLTRAFDAPSWIKLVSLIVEGPSPSLSSQYSEELNKILQRILSKDPAQRPSANEILHLPYLVDHGKVLSAWLQDTLHQDKQNSVSEDATRIAAAMQEKLHLDSLHAMRCVQEMAPRQRRRIRKEEQPETYMKKMKRAVERLYQEKHQQLEQNVLYEANGAEVYYHLNPLPNPELELRVCMSMLKGEVVKKRKKKRFPLVEYKELHLPQLSSSAYESLEAPISHSEISKTIKALPPGKSPGPDGFTQLYFQTFQDKLVPILSEAYASFPTGIGSHPSLTEAHISVFPKPGKDLQNCESFRPISLVNLDLKIYAKILAECIKPLLTSLINTDQVGFVPGREARYNTRKLLNIIHFLQDGATPAVFLSTDAEKAFDRKCGHRFIEADTCSESWEESSEEEDNETYSGSVLSISMPLSEEQSSTLSAYQSCLQRFLDSSTDDYGVGIRDSVLRESVDGSVSFCNMEEITRLRQDCIGLLGEDGFCKVYEYLKQVSYFQDSDYEEVQTMTLCEPQEMRLYPQHCWKVQQLLFLEERMKDESLGAPFAWL